MHRVISPGNFDKPLLLRNLRYELIGYPTQIIGIYLQNFVQKMSPVFAEEYQIFSATLHPFFVVFHEDEAAARIIKHTACHAQRCVYIGGPITNIKNSPPFGGRGIKPEGVVGVDWKSTRLNSSHPKISYALFCF